jgi:ATP-dependent DNA helicase PIF1
VAEPTSRWSALQARAISLVLDGKNVVITGPAGSGKSAVTDFLRLELARRGAKVAVAGTTGTSAYNIGGKTIHSFLRVGIKIDEQTKVRAGAELASFCL